MVLTQIFDNDSDDIVWEILTKWSVLNSHEYVIDGRIVHHVIHQLLLMC